MHKLSIIGGGGGVSEYILSIGENEIKSADRVIASERFIKNFNVKNFQPMGNLYELADKLPSMLEKEKIAVVVSGDPLMYSFCNIIIKKYPDMDIKIIPGVSSLQILGCLFGITMENSVILSIHGRACSKGKIAYTVSQNSEVFFLCSKDSGVKKIAQALDEYNVRNCEIFIGENLTYENQKLTRGKPEDFLEYENNSLCCVIIRNPYPVKYFPPALLPDTAFLRNSSPMTKEEIRAVIISKLRLRPDSIVWDIGAGTGSISVECARFCPFGSVYAVEYKNTALEILKKNKEYFSLENLEIYEGRAKMVMDCLPSPDCIFIGGSGKEFNDILDKIKKSDKNIRFVMSAVTLETQGEAYSLLKDMPDFNVIQVSVSRAKQIGDYNILNSNHPVVIYSCYTKEEKNE